MKTLSDKEVLVDAGFGRNGPIYNREAVKEFIKQLKEDCPRCYGARKNINLGKCDVCDECKKINELAGDKLI